MVIFVAISHIFLMECDKNLSVRRARRDRVCLGGSPGRETQSKTQRKHLFSMMQSTGTISPNTESSTRKLN